jgi:hypothetical protein
MLWYRYRAGVVAVNALGASRPLDTALIGFDNIPQRFTFTTLPLPSTQLAQAQSAGARPFISQPSGVDVTASDAPVDQGGFVCVCAYGFVCVCVCA